MIRKMLIGFVFVFWGGLGRAEPVTIVAFGDSLVQGYGLFQQNGFVPQLQTWLSGHGAETKLINAGVSGDTTAGGAARVAWTLTPDVDAMIVVLGGNDLLRGIDPAVSRANLDQILQTAQQASVPVLLVGQNAPGNFGPEYQASFDAIYPDLAAAYDTLYVPGFFDGLAGPGADPAELRVYMQDDGLHPNPEGVARIVDALGPQVLELVKRATP